MGLSTRPNYPHAVKIVNPQPGKHDHLGYAHALRKIRQGRAVWAVEDFAVLMIREKKIRAQVQADLNLRARIAAQKCGYDAVARPLRLSEIRRLPMCSPDPTNPAVPLIRRRPRA